MHLLYFVYLGSIHKVYGNYSSVNLTESYILFENTATIMSKNTNYFLIKLKNGSEKSKSG